MIRRRLDRDSRFLAQAVVASTGATCARRRVGCVLVDAAGLVLATGCNGPASGQPHCIDSPCSGAGLASGTGLHSCRAVHAEQNALMQCSDVRRIDTCYTTTSPCEHCVKMLLNTGCRKIVFLDLYPGHEDSYWLWTNSLTQQVTYTLGERDRRSWLRYVMSDQGAGGHMLRALRDAVSLALDGEPHSSE